MTEANNRCSYTATPPPLSFLHGMGTVFEDTAFVLEHFQNLIYTHQRIVRSRKGTRTDDAMHSVSWPGEVEVHLIFNHSNSWRWFVSFTLRPLYFRTKMPHFPLEGKLRWSRAGLKACEEHETLISISGNRTMISWLSTRKPTSPSRVNTRGNIRKLQTENWTRILISPLLRSLSWSMFQVQRICAREGQISLRLTQFFARTYRLYKIPKGAYLIARTSFVCSSSSKLLWKIQHV